MLRRAEEMTRDVREKMRGGDGEVEILHIFKTDEIKGKARLFARLRLARGCSIGYHEHAGEEEIFYIIAGRGVVSDGGEEHEVGPGDAVLTGGGAGHSVRNDREEPLEIMAVILLTD